jgi:Ca-activated chloride channel family protein
LARFQQGDYAGAAKFFQQSAQSASADLAARSMYNQGNSLYAQSLKALPQMPAGADGQEPPIPPEALQQAMQQVDQALTHFKDAAAANPSDEDSAANAESSLRLLKELRKLQQEQQQQQQKQDQKNQQQPQDQQQKQDQKNQQQPQDQQQKQDPQPGSTGEQAQGKTPNVDREQADRLLQMVRDKEKERNAQKRQAAGPARPTPVDRDW